VKKPNKVPEMKRLWSTIQVDWKVQYRSGLMAASAVSTILLLVGMRWAAASWDSSEIALGVAGALFAQFLVIACYQMAREKGDGTLALLRVTPLRPHEYLASKVGTWLALGLAQSVVIGIVATGVGPGLFLFLGGMSLLLPFAVLAGFLVATLFDRGPTLVGACLGALFLSAMPWLFSGTPDAPGWMTLHPMQSGLTWMRMGSESHSLGMGLLALGIEGFWLAVSLVACKKTLARVGQS
jgi:fluoroquinolone transport system permease protein